MRIYLRGELHALNVYTSIFWSMPIYICASLYACLSPCSNVYIQKAYEVGISSMI